MQKKGLSGKKSQEWCLKIGSESPQYISKYMSKGVWRPIFWERYLIPGKPPTSSNNQSDLGIRPWRDTLLIKTFTRVLKTQGYTRYAVFLFLLEFFFVFYLCVFLFEMWDVSGGSSINPLICCFLLEKYFKAFAYIFWTLDNKIKAQSCVNLLQVNEISRFPEWNFWLPHGR